MISKFKDKFKVLSFQSFKKSYIKTYDVKIVFEIVQNQLPRRPRVAIYKRYKTYEK